MWGRCVLEIKLNATASPRPWEGAICLSNTNSRDCYQTLGYLPNWPYEQGHEGKFRISGVFAHIPCYQRVDVFAAMNMTAISPDPPQGVCRPPYTIMGENFLRRYGRHPTPLGPTIVISTKNMLMIRRLR